MPGEAALLVEARVSGARPDQPRLDVRLEFEEGLTAIMGPSGAGKSTLLSAVAGLLRPDAGRIMLRGRLFYDQQEAVFVPPEDRRVALVFQSLALFPHLSVWENVAYGLPAGGAGERRERAQVWLDRARVGKLAARRIDTLSGGEAQRVALARALASEPRALLLDEPFSALDATLRRELGDALAELVAQLAIPVLLVTHDRADAERLARHIVALEAGRLHP